MMKLVYGLHQESPREVKLKGWLHHGCLSGDHREQKVSRGGEVSDKTSSPKVQKVKFMMELQHGSPKEHEASVEASP